MIRQINKVLPVFYVIDIKYRFYISILIKTYINLRLNATVVIFIAFSRIILRLHIYLRRKIKSQFNYSRKSTLTNS